MLFRTHFIFGILLGLLFMNYFDEKIIFFIFVLIGSILPDIDTPKSKIGKKVFLSRIFKFFLGHRGFIHSIYPVIFVFVVFYYFNMVYAGWGFLIGYLGHLVLDGLTKQGVNFLQPLSSFKIRGFIKVGGFLEKIVFGLIIVLILVRLGLIL